MSKLTIEFDIDKRTITQTLTFKSKITKKTMEKTDYGFSNDTDFEDEFEGESLPVLSALYDLSDIVYEDTWRSLEILNELSNVEKQPSKATSGKRDSKHGCWRSWKEQFPNRKFKEKANLGVFCSVCESYADNKTNYCPHCGSKMNGDR